MMIGFLIFRGANVGIFFETTKKRWIIDDGVLKSVIP